MSLLRSIAIRTVTRPFSSGVTVPSDSVPAKYFTSAPNRQLFETSPNWSMKRRSSAASFIPHQPTGVGNSSVFLLESSAQAVAGKCSRASTK